MQKKMVKIKFKKLHPNAIIPSYKNGYGFSNAVDLTCVGQKYTEQYIEYETGLAVEIPLGYTGFLVPRSSNSDYTLLLSNSCGIIDSWYRGQITFRYKSIYLLPSYGLPPKYYQIGDRVGQLLIVETPEMDIEEVDELSETVRDKNGYGSTGK